MLTADQHVLDNPIWNGLLTGNSAFASGNNLARNIRRDMGDFAAIQHDGPAAWKALYGRR